MCQIKLIYFLNEKTGQKKAKVEHSTFAHYPN